MLGTFEKHWSMWQESSEGGNDGRRSEKAAEGPDSRAFWAVLRTLAFILDLKEDHWRSGQRVQWIAKGSL